MGIYKTTGLQHASNSNDHISLCIASINEALITLPWLETCFGEAEKRLINSKLEPVVFIATDEGVLNSKASYTPVRPTREFGSAFSFFNPVVESVSEVSRATLNYFSSAEYELIVFCNLAVINPNKGSRFERELAKDVRILLQKTIFQGLVGDVTTIFSEVYEDYDLEEWEESLTQHPYAAFKISFTINETTEC